MTYMFSLPPAGRAESPSITSIWTDWAALAGLVFDVPLLGLTLRDAEGQAAVQAFGPGSDALLEGGFGSLGVTALAQGGLFVVEDARTDTVLRQHPCVVGTLKVAFVAAVALKSPTGRSVGALHLMDNKPRHFSPAQVRTLVVLARVWAGHWEALAAAERASLHHQALEQSHGWLLESVSQDPLTQLANRRALMAFLDKTLALARREHQPMAVLLLDVKGLKRINARWGDEVGDRVLAEVAQRLAACARGSELVGRMAGDEFMAVLYPCSPAQATQAAERFAQSVEGLAIPGVDEAGQGVSLWVAEWATREARDHTPDGVYRQVALALDQAKGIARDSVAAA